MALTKRDRQNIYRNLVDATCGQYQFGDLTIEQQKQAIRLLQARLISYKNNENALEEYGPLQPAYVLSQIAKVPIEVVEAICETIGLQLPDEINVEDEDYDAMLPDIEIQDDDFFHDADIMLDNEGPINFVRGMLGRLEAGEIHSISIAAVDYQGEAQLWVPENIEDERVVELFSPIIDALAVGVEDGKKESN